jgi:UDP:flavonoid glycosyltransferase YjiC (YdhE family)
MLALPLVNDQYMVAKRITSMQLGISGNMKEISSNQLRDMLKTLLTDNTIKHNVMLVSQEMKNSINLDVVAEKMEEYAKSGKKGY